MQENWNYRSMKNLLSILLMQLPVALLAQDTLFFDADWNETSAEKHVYYRLLPQKKVGELLFIQDYYKGGTLQMQGYALASDEQSYVGDAYWYDEAGYDQSTKQSLNRSTVKELRYYHPDGSLWKIQHYGADGRIARVRVYWQDKELSTGEVSAGNRYSGHFSPTAPDRYYDSDSNGQEVLEEVAPLSLESETGEKAAEKVAYTETTYWMNGQRATEQQFDWYHRLQHTKHWDMEGKQLSTYSFEEVGTRFTYYTKNGFATAIELMEEREEGEQMRRTVSNFSRDGNLLSKSLFVDGLVQEVVSYQDGKLSSTQKYRDGEPFDGLFVNNQGIRATEYRMEQGEIVGEVLTKDHLTDSVFAKGTYREGKPFEGSFFLTVDTYQLLRYREGKQDGWQTDYADYVGLEVGEEYEMKAGVKDGVSRTYRDGKLLFESVYRNGAVSSGTVLEGNQELTYSKGHLEKRGTTDSRGLVGITKTENFMDKQPTSVVYSDFTIEEHPQESYTGIYRDGKPYDGYFKLDTLVDDITLVSYFEKGKLQCKYSFELLEQMENYLHYTYNLKTTYDKGKIMDGPEYKLIGRERLLTSHYEQGELQAFDVNLFAMHYFNRLSAKLEGQEILLTEMAAPLQLKAYVKGGDIVADLIRDGKTLKSSRTIRELVEGSAHSVTQYYLADNQIKTYIATADLGEEPFDGDDEEQDMEQSFVRRLFYLFPIQHSNDLRAVFKQLYDNFQQEHFNRVFETNINGAYPVNEENFLTILQYDAVGKPLDGIRLQTQKDGKVLAEAWEQGKIKETKLFDSMADLLQDDRKVFRALEYRLLNE